jgi:hypothetical protein
MLVNRRKLEAILEAEVRRVAWTRQAILKQRTDQGAKPSFGKTLSPEPILETIGALDQGRHPAPSRRTATE